MLLMQPLLLLHFAPITCSTLNILLQAHQVSGDCLLIHTSLLARSYSAFLSSTVAAVLSLFSSASSVILALYVRNTCRRSSHHASMLACTCAYWQHMQSSHTLLPAGESDGKLTGRAHKGQCDVTTSPLWVL